MLCGVSDNWSIFGATSPQTLYQLIYPPTVFRIVILADDSVRTMAPREARKCGAGVLQSATGEDTRFTLAACQENIAMSGDRANVEDGCEAGSKNRDIREAKKCGAGVPARAPHWATGEDARFTLAVCHQTIAISGAVPS